MNSWKSLVIVFLIGVFLVNNVKSRMSHSNGYLESRMINGEYGGFVPYTTRVTGFSMAYSTEGGGSFITLRHIVTAASIVHKMSIMYVYYGNESMATAKSLSGLGVTHPEYDPFTFENDIGMVTLGTAAAEDLATTIALPGRQQRTPLINEQGKVSGFGLRLDEVRGWVLNFAKQTGNFRVIDEEQCRSKLGDKQELIADSHFCTENGASLCFGDHGSGLVVHIGDEEVLVGLVSVITNMCHGSQPVMFTRLEPYVDWIKEQLN